MKNIVVYADGGSRLNPGPAACGYALYEVKQDFFVDLNHKHLQELPYLFGEGIYIDKTTNNVAEWMGLIKSLEKVQELFPPNTIRLFVFLDSDLVVKQINGVYKVKQIHLQPLHENAKKLLGEFTSWQVVHIYREYNKVADKLVNEALDKATKK